mmetsp:Transcript_27431/g.81692  ORF Transcript_27431/g.81692 Transcript_27431/m.81692 type:complete len:228 (+) Transcript_27431:394-1077(+)
MMTRSALVRFRPTPPTLVVRSMHWKRSCCSSNLRTFSPRVTASVFPSMRRQRSPFGFSTQICTRSSIFTLCEKTRVRWPRLARAGSSRARHRSFALWASRESALLGSLRAIISAARPARASSEALETAPVLSPCSLARPTAASVSEALVSSVGTTASSVVSLVGADGSVSTASPSTSFQAPGFDIGSTRSGWFESRLRRPMAWKTSTPSLPFSAAWRITSLFSRTFL